jgi:hypothetical protein
MGEKVKPDWGSTFLRTRDSREQYIYERSWRDFNFLEWTYIITSLICLTSSTGFSIYMIVLGKYLFPIVTIVTCFFGVYFLYNGVLQESQFQVLMQILTKIVGWIFDLIYFLNSDADNESAEVEVKRIRFFVNSALVAINIPCGAIVIWKYWKSKVALFRGVGTEPRYVRMYQTLVLAYSLLAFDSEITIAAVILIAVPVTAGSSALSTWHQITILSSGIPMIGLWALLGYYVMSRERKYLTFLFYFFSHLHILYVIYLLAKTPRSVEADSAKERYNFLLLRNTIYFIAAAFFVTHAALMITVVKIQLSYGKGLKQAAAKQDVKKRSLGQEEEMLKPVAKVSAIETEI